ncbi:uncharacterized protein EMH_0002620 [Eimeria mitis]|uniref:Uncharacterized protein n=1 Tax=Eimeria mitis TaxID=44415 RepID=U6KDD1_9EIME|nr:uncharacterized protein EMH_0002620 [Eimeria mitis]CDJ35939.1 hypothetical protein, conserved [Eimeria mitis]
MAAKKAVPGLGIEEEAAPNYVEGPKLPGEWPPNEYHPPNDGALGRVARPGKLPRRRGRKWLLWIAAVGVFALLGAKLCTQGSSSHSLKKKRDLGVFGLDESHPPFGDPGSEFWDLDGERKAIVAFAPFMAGDTLYFEGSAHLRPQNIPFTLEQYEDLAIGRSGVPKAWEAYHQGKRTEDEVVEDQGPSEGPIDLDWLSEFAIPVSVEEGGKPAPARLQISSGDAMKVAREVSNRYFGTFPVEEQKESPEAAANRVFSRLVGRLGSGLVTAIMDAGRLSNMKFDSRSRNLRSELALLEIGNEVERLKERQNEVLERVEQARRAKEAGDESGQAEAQLEEAIQTYKTLLRCEKNLMETLVQLASRWTEETNKLLTTVASVVTSSAMSDIEEIAKMECSVFNIAKVGKKAYSMSDVLQTEARSKNRCRLVGDVAGKRIKDIGDLLCNIDKLSSDEFAQRVQRQNEELAKSRTEFRSVLAKKKQELWLADII